MKSASHPPPEACLTPASPQSSESAPKPPSELQQLASTTKIRVCHVSMCLTTGGLERLLIEFARRTNPQRFEVEFVALGEIGQPAAEISDLGLSVTQLAPQGGKRWQLFQNLRKHFQTRKIDVVHSHNTYAHFYATLAAKLAGVPVVLNTQHGRGCGTTWKQRSHFLLANRMANCILAVSEDSARICRQQDPLSRGKIKTLWNGIDLNRFEFHGPQPLPHAISVARLSPEKDFPTLLRATRLVSDHHPEFRLTIVGDGSERPHLEKLTQQLHLQKVVTFLGERRDIPELLKQAGLFVSSSSTEGISLTLLEAMAVGLPIITTAVGGNPEIVDPGATGHLVPAGQPQQLAQAIRQHLQQPDLWPAMSQLSRLRVEQQFEISRMIQDYQNLYEDLTQR